MLAAPAIARAQAAWPNAPIRIIVPFPPGGSTDALSRMLGAAAAGPQQMETWARVVRETNIRLD